MASNRSKPSPISTSAAPPPPRTLNVQKFAESRAPELESLHEIVAGRLGHGFRIQRGKRRRTTGHLVAKSRRRKRRKVSDDGEPGDGVKKVSRRARRRAELQENPLTGFCLSGDGTKRLRTHLWHAKRFTMVKLWGFYLPLGLQGRGRGSRSILKCLKSGTLVHDASYCSPIQLDGPEDSILSVLKMVLLPSRSDNSDKLYKPIAYGVCYENAMLYHVGTHPTQLIAPVMYMWRPCDGGNAHICVEKNHISDCCSPPDKNVGKSLSSRQLWIWIHAAAFNEGFDAVRSACQRQMDESGISVSCSSLVGHLAKLEVTGSRANQAIKKLLHPVPEPDHAASISSDSIEDPISQVKKSYIMHHAENLPSCAVFSLKACDPRDLPSRGTESIPEVAFTKQANNLKDDNVTDANVLISEISGNTEDLLPSLWSEPEVNGVFLSDSEGLWGTNDELSPPLQENILCEEKHLKRLEFFCLDQSNNPTPVSGSRNGSFRSCPVLLLKHKDIGNSIMGWSIILPLSWAKVFWVALVSHGAHAIGIRERRWVACNNGLPSFPFDFPDCEAYSSFMAAKCIETDRNTELRPPAAQPLKVPVSPPWTCVMSTIERGQSIIDDHQTPVIQESDHEAVLDGTLVNPVFEKLDSSSLEQAATSFQGFIPRTSNALSQYVEKKADDKHLLLFPDLSLPTGENWFSCLTRCSNLKQVDRELCFIRVLLHAYKEGFFQEGAVVCAPTPTDLSHWTSRSDEEKESLQIPQRVLKSFFSQNVSGKWELHLPKDNATWQTHRWPIGFITSGFVPGKSGKPVAVAFCEARLLSLLRKQQWSMNKRSRPEIFVLVRNLRSTAYRRALATIVLEHKKDDLDFM